MNLVVPALALLLAATPSAGKAGAKKQTTTAKKGARAAPATAAAPTPAAAPATPAVPDKPPADAPTAAVLDAPVAPAAAPEAAPAEETKRRAVRVAVLQPDAQGVEERLLRLFTDAIVPELRKLEGVSAIGVNEIRDMLEFERQRQLVGCTDTGCLAEIAGALGVDEIVTLQIGLVGENYMVSSRRMSMRRGKVVNADSRQIEKRDGEELLALVGPVIETLYNDRPLKAGRVRGVDEAVVRRLNPPPLPRWAPLTTGGIGLLALAGGVAFGLQSKNYENLYNNEAQRSTTELVSGAMLRGLEDDARTSATRANILFAVGGGLALLTGIEALFTDWHGDGDVQAAPVVSPDGAGVAVSGKF